MTSLSAERFDVSTADADMAWLIGEAIANEYPLGIDARPWVRPRFVGAGWRGLDVFLLEVGDRPWWSVVNRTPTGWDYALDIDPVGMRADDPRWSRWEGAA